MWKKVKLNDLCDVITCGVAKRPDYVELGVPFLSSLNVKENRIILDKYNYVSEQDHYKLTKYAKPEKGDILYTRVGSFGQAAVIDIELEFSVFVSLTLIKPKKKLLNSRYLMWYLNSPKVRQFASENTSGIGVQNLNVSVVRKYEIPLPPLPIQEKIAEILDKADELRRKDQDLQAKYDELAQAIFIDMFGDPVRNEKGWDVKRFEELGYLKNGLNYGNNESGKELKVFGVGDFKSNWLFDDYKNLKTLSLDSTPNDSFLLADGDILFVRSNGNKDLIGRAILLKNINEAMTYSGFCIKFTRTSLDVNEYYLIRLLVNSKFKKYILNGGRGANIQNINQEILSALIVPIPPIALQKEFAKKIKLINQLKAQTNAEKSEELFQSLLQKAFKGELTID